MNFRTIADLDNTVSQNLLKIDNDFDLIVGVPRSGILAGTIISLYLNLPLADLDSFLDCKVYSCGSTRQRDDWITSVDDAKKVLVVDDSCDSGAAISKARKLLSNRFPKKVFKYLAVYVTEKSMNNVDIGLDICPTPRMFEWNYLHHKGLSNVCFDIDGVLCEDPTEEQNDDGERYKSFLQNTPVRIRPSFMVGHLVTSRLEKYRGDTIGWLDRNDIKFGDLTMMSYSTKEERLKHGDHAEFKAKVYKSMPNSYLFVESDPGQASVISRLSGKTVFCTSTQTVFDESERVKTLRHIKSSAKEHVPQGLKDIVKRLIRRNR